MAGQVVMSKDDLSALLREAVSQTPPSKVASLSNDELESLVERGVKNAFTKIGIDCKNPLEMQKDFAFIRRVRKSADQIRSQGMITAVGILVTAVITVIWLGIKAAITEHK
jgi:hypothetical protein